MVRRVAAALAVVLLAAAFAAATAGCGGAGSSGAGDAGPAAGAGGAPHQGGTYRYPLIMDPGPFDPSLTTSSESVAVLHQVYEGLVRWEEQPDGTLKTVPCLAESWEGNADATVWTFRLRRGVLFQAPVSREVTAQDVVADLRYLSDAAHEYQVAYLFIPIAGTDENGYAKPGVLGVEALDRFTVRFTLKHPFSEFPDTLGSMAFYVWPVDCLRKVGVKAYGRHPVGTGPYQFARRASATSVELTRNPRWWDTSGGPYIDTIRYEVFGSATAMMLAFQKGAIDWAFVPTGEAAASRSLPQVTSGQWTAETTANLAERYLWFNMRDAVVGGSQGLALRQALTYGCDRQAVSDASSGGVFLVPTTGVVPPGVAGSHDVREPYAYDPDKAKEMVDGIGPVTLRLAWPIAQQQEGTVASLKASFAKIGITIETKGLAFDDYMGYLAAGKAQLCLGGWLADYPSMDDFLYPLFESGQTPYNYATCYSNPEVDALLEEARATPDEKARLEKYAEAERRILADAAAVPLIVFADARLLNNRVADVRFNSMRWADLWRAWVR